MPKTFANKEHLDREVLYALYQHKSKMNAVPRWDLVRMVFGQEAAIESKDETDGNTWDRQVRESIERWRKQGHHIANIGDGNGYFICADRREYEEFKQYYLGSSYPKFENVKVMDEHADRLWGREPKPHPLQPELL